MAKQKKIDEFLTTEFDLANEYIREFPQFALCRVRHDISLHRPPVDISYAPDGTYTHIYICPACKSEYHRRYFADGRFHSSKWDYTEGYRKKGVGYALTSRSGRAAFNRALDEIMSKQPKKRVTRGRKS